MFAATVILVVVSVRPLEAIIIDSYYMPSVPKEQIYNTVVSRTAKQQVAPKNRQHEVLAYDLNINEEGPKQYVVPAERQNKMPEYDVYPTTKPLYKYGYSVFDPYTMDVKSQWEHRDGDVVRGAYNMLEADGSLRIVEYTSDKDIGFRAVVKKIPGYMERIQRPVETFTQITKNQMEGSSSSPTFNEPRSNTAYQLNDNYQQSENQEPRPVRYREQQYYAFQPKESLAVQMHKN